MILAKYDIDNFQHPIQEYWCPFIVFSNEFDSFFSKELLELASLMRLSLDVSDNVLSKEDIEVISGERVGFLNCNEQKIDLNLREACNKIIHANSYEIAYDYGYEHPLNEWGYEDYDNPVNFKNPKIFTFGQFRKQEWKAEIHFFKFLFLVQRRFSQ